MPSLRQSMTVMSRLGCPGCCQCSRTAGAGGSSSAWLKSHKRMVESPDLPQRLSVSCVIPGSGAAGLQMSRAEAAQAAASAPEQLGPGDPPQPGSDPTAGWSSLPTCHRDSILAEPAGVIPESGAAGLQTSRAEAVQAAASAPEQPGPGDPPQPGSDPTSEWWSLSTCHRSAWLAFWGPFWGPQH